jgi:L1 cell adhesion molecule like protein
MVDHFVQEFEHKHQKDLTTDKRALSKLRTACERAKRMLSVSTQASIELDTLYQGIDFYTSVQRFTFEELNEDFFSSTMKAVEDSLREAKMDKKEIHDIVLVGGSTRIPMMQELLQDFFNGKELNKSINSDEAVAYGAAVQAAILAGELKGLVLVDVNPLSLVIDTFGSATSVLIKRNTPIPSKQSISYTTVKDNQAIVSFGLYECELAMTKNQISLGKFKLVRIPPAQRGVPQIEVTFEIDANGMLNVTAVENSTGKENKITVTNDKSGLGKEEIERMAKDAEKYRAEDEKQKQTTSAQNALESYCFNMMSEVEDEILKDKISESDKNTILDKCNEVICWLDGNQLAEKEEFEFQQKELESVCNPIMTKMYQGAGSSGGMPGEFPGAGGPAPDGGETPWTERLQGEFFGRRNRDEHHKEDSDTSYGGTGENKRGKQSYVADVRNLALSRGSSNGFEAKHGTFI